ncbi:MAG: hypothetical protein L0Z62_03490 [Gemmataceae bacterium]|nr:hypothetical protein [Gemmataceae bacterium]
MKERERLVVSGLVVLVLILWLGFLVHRSPRFAGSLWGGVLGVSGGLLMLVPLAYLIVKRIPPLKKMVTQRVSMRTLLTWHIYAGIVGPILAILHTGHKFDSPLGIALTTMMLLVVLSGFVGRYLMSQFSQTIREKKEMLTQLEMAYRETAGELAAHPEQMALLQPLAGFWSRLVAGFFLGGPGIGQGELAAPVRALRLAESMADLEYAIKTHETFKRWFAGWLKFHIVISFILYGLLALHVWAGIHFGLRWFS